MVPFWGTLSKITPCRPEQPGPAAPAGIFIAFGERNAIMTTGYITSKYRRDEVESTYELSFEVT